MDTKLDKKVDNAGGVTRYNAVYLGVCTVAVLIGRQAVDQDVSFGRLLHRLRKAHDLTQEAMAQQAYCAIDTIRKIEAGVRRPSRQLAEQFADCLDLADDERATFVAAARVGPLAGADAPGGALEMLDLPTTSRPTGTVTFLYTDIEGRAALAQHYRAALPKLLTRNHAILRQSIEAQRGSIFQITGDAFCAAFHTVADALHAAIHAQHHLQTEPWQPVPLNVRMGIHTGEAQAGASEAIAAGYDWYLTLTCAQRVMSAAHGGQVLLSNASAELLRGQFPEGVTLRDLGEYHLNGLLSPERVWQVAAVDVRSDFPPLMARSAMRNNPPLQLSSFIGRERAIADVQHLLTTTRLLTLTGVGGTGKTRLALQVASAMEDIFRDGVWFVDLASISDATSVVPTIARTLGLHESAGATIDEVLTEYLREKDLLLVLDNFEQVIDAAPAVKGLLTTTPRVSMLITSRALLRIGGEREYAVPLLGVPDTYDVPSPELLTTYEAARLFIERAQAVKADFTVTAENAPAVVAICVWLEGLPLAIELAAARVRVLPPQKLLLLLQRRLQVLVSTARDLPARHQTLRAAIGWSYDLLTTGEQRLFRQFAVFLGGATLEAIAAICDPDGATDVLGGVESLVDKSLLKQNDLDGEPRFTMLETVREYALEQLESREEATIRNRHLGFFLRLGEEGKPHQIAWLKRLEREHDNLRAALRWAFEPKLEEPATNRAELGLQLAGALASFWFRHSHWSEGRSWLREALAHCPAGSPVVRAKALLGAGYLAAYQSDYEQGVSLLEQSLSLYRAQNNQRGIANALSHLGGLAGDQGDYPQAIAMTQESLSRHRQINYRPGVASTLHLLGELVYRQGDYSRATQFLEESLAVSRELGDKRGMGGSLSNLGLVALNQGELERATALCTEALALHREIGDRRQTGSSLHALALVMHGQGNQLAARALLAEALTLLVEVQDKNNIASCLDALAGIAIEEGAWERAARVFGAAEALRQAINVPAVYHQRADYERYVAAVRAQLDETMLAEVWAAGRAMTLEQAIAEALNATSPIPAQSHPSTPIP